MSTPSKAQLLKASIAKRSFKKRKALAIQKAQASKKAMGFFTLLLLGSQKKISNTNFNQTDSTAVPHASYHATSTSAYSVPTLVQVPSVISSSAKLLATMALFKYKDFSTHTSSVIFAALSSQFKVANAEVENIEVSIDPVPKVQQFYATSSATTSRHLRDLSKKEINLKPEDQVSFIRNKTINLIKLSKSAIEYYDLHPTLSFVQDRDKLTQAISMLAKDKDLYCKLSSIFEEANTGFKLEICVPDELPVGILAMYKWETNTLLIPIELFSRTESFLSSAILHELHHPFVNHQNRKMGRQFFIPERKKDHSISTPCNPDLATETLDCKEIIRLQQAGSKNVDEMLVILTTQEIHLNSDQKKLLAKYKLAVEGYKPIIENRSYPKSKLIVHQKNGDVDEQLKFKDPRKGISFSDHGFTRFFYSMEFLSEDYVTAYVQNSKTDDYLKAPLHDFKFYLKMGIFENETLGRRIKETDAIIHQIFGRYPRLIDFLYEGLREYHAARSDVTYQRCRA